MAEAAAETAEMPIEEGAPPTEKETPAEPPPPSGTPVADDEPVIKQPPISAIEEKLNQHIKAKSRMRRMLPDIIRVVLAFTVISIGVAIWWKPPLMTASFPVTTYIHKNSLPREAALFRPMAMQERYYVQLPEKLEGRYEWFAIDRRQEVVALCEEPVHSFLGNKAIKRGDPLGMDLEFRTIEGHEWLIHFFTDAIVFSNNVLSVRLDTKQAEK